MVELTITNETLMSEVLKKAATTAKVTQHKLISPDGVRCLWGEAFHLIGISDEILKAGSRVISLFGLFILPGTWQWDSGQKADGLSIALNSWGELTVKEARELLQKNGAQLQPLGAT